MAETDINNPEVGSRTEASLRDASVAASDGTPQLESLLDIPVSVSVEIGRARMTVREFLRLSKDSVVELDKPVGEPLEILVNGKCVARGTAVVVNERFGVRLTEVVSQPERAERLK